MTPAQFKAKWAKFSGKESAAYQEHFNDLCRMLGLPTPIEADPTGNEHFCFQKFVAKEAGLFDLDATDGNQKRGFADVWKKDCFDWEYKGPGEDLGEAEKQFKLYRESLLNPPLVVLCDFHRYVIKTNFNGTSPDVHEFTNDEIDSPRVLRLLRSAFTAPEELRPGQTTAEVTERLAKKIAAIARSLQEREAVELASAKTRKEHSVAQKKNLRIARFLNRLVFCFFAEDTRLLPEGIFGDVCAVGLKNPKLFAETLEDLFKCMAKGGRFGTHRIRHFNGHLFEDATVFELLPEEIEQLADAAKSDWQNIEPSIMGTLFQRALDEDQRAALGAQYTGERDIRDLLEPVLMAPLRREWRELRRDLAPLLAKGKSTNAARVRLAAFQKKLAALIVLDPACGSGNFLYVALQLLLGLEKEVITAAALIGFTFTPQVNVQQLRAIEINPYAYELAQVSVQLGALQWRRDNGFDNDRTPVLQNLDGFENKDALLNETFRKKPKDLKAAQAEEHGGQDELFKVYTERAWPACDVIVGNPPFLGGKMLRRELGDKYVDALFENFGGRVRPEADLCCYWFEKAREQIEEGKCARAGLLATQGIRGGANRDVLKRIKDTGDIFFAVSDRDWILAGASVHVSMVAFDNGTETLRSLDGKDVAEIHPNLAASGADITTACRLPGNLDIAFMGDTKGGAFDISEAQALKILRDPNPNGRPSSDVIVPWVNGLDVTRRPRRMFIIDFGLTRTAEECALYEAAYEYIREYVRPVRLGNKRALYARNWWRHVEPRPGMLSALAERPRFLTTVAVSKHRIFAWMEAPTLPDHQVFAFALDDDFFFGVLHSRFHEAWARANGTQVRERESGFRYTPTSCFETFPFPFADDTTQDALQAVAKFRAAHYHYDQSNILREDPPPTSPAEHRKAIAAAARDLNEQREKWLNPPELTVTRTLEFYGSTDGPWSRFVTKPDARGVGTVRYPVAEPRNAECAAQLMERTLTNLYNKRDKGEATWLASAHAKLDAAVAAAYGWPADLSDDEILSRLLALNLKRTAAETKTAGAKRTRTSREKGADEML